MTEDHFIHQFQAAWPPKPDELPDLVKLSETAVACFPASPGLLCIAGDLLRMQENITDDDIAKSIAYYEKAIEADSDWADAHEELGHIYDVYDNNFDRAISYFRKAISLGAGWTAYAGIAKSLVQDGFNTEALAELTPEKCPFWNHDSIQKVRNKIESGDWNKI
jgi:tetratricopeptide (TPR) repeat protein